MNKKINIQNFKHKKIVTVKNTKWAININNIKKEDSENKRIVEEIKKIAESDYNFYLVFGGTGDLLLVLAECYKDISGKLIWFANTSSVELGTQLISHFNVDAQVYKNLMGTRFANYVQEILQKTGRLKPSAHLARNLDYNDWARDKKFYENKMTPNTNWLQEIGTINQLKDKNLLVLAPSGSIRHAAKKRYIEKNDYQNLVNMYLEKKWIVHTIGSEEDYQYYPKIIHENFLWLTSKNSIDSLGNIKEHSISHFLMSINSANHVISVDTWLKTYTLLCGIPTIVIRSKYNDSYLDWGVDASDCVFLNTNLWPNLRIIQLEDYIKEFYSYYV